VLERRRRSYQKRNPRGTLVAVAPVVGTARVVSAASKLVRALGLAEALSDEDDEGDDAE
jgi:hypothetical protein